MFNNDFYNNSESNNSQFRESIVQKIQLFLFIELSSVAEGLIFAKSLTAQLYEVINVILDSGRDDYRCNTILVYNNHGGYFVA